MSLDTQYPDRNPAQHGAATRRSLTASTKARVRVNDCAGVPTSMLHADKELLEKSTAVRLIHIRQRELHLYSANSRKLAFVTVVMAGIAYFGLIYCSKMPYFIESKPLIKFWYANGLVICMCLSLYNCVGATLISMLGPGYALRGKEGAIHVAVDGMLDELEGVVKVMHLSVYSFLAPSLAYAWTPASPHWVSSVVISLVIVCSGVLMMWRTGKVEVTFPLRKIRLTSGAFFSRADSQPPSGATAQQDTRQPQPAPSLPRQRTPQPHAASHELF